MLQIHAACVVLPNNVRNIDCNENVGLLLHEADQCEHDGHEFGLVGAALLFGAWRRRGEEVVGWCVRAVGLVSSWLRW